jgi:nucleoside-diphosphate-sugar epimerase
MVICLQYIAYSAVTGLAGFAGTLLAYWLFDRREPLRIAFREPEVVITKLYTVKENGSIEPVEPSSLPLEKQKVVKEKIKSLKEGLKHEAIQRVAEEWRKHALRRALVLGIGSFIAFFIIGYLLYLTKLCPTP